MPALNPAATAAIQRFVNQPGSILSEPRLQVGQTVAVFKGCPTDYTFYGECGLILLAEPKLLIYRPALFNAHSGEYLPDGDEQILWIGPRGDGFVVDATHLAGAMFYGSFV